MVMCSTGLQEFSKVAHLIVEMDEKPDAEVLINFKISNFCLKCLETKKTKSNNNSDCILLYKFKTLSNNNIL